jgi:hypothetical protein
MNDLSIVKQENIQTILADAPAAYEQNHLSHDRCIAAGNQLIEEIQQNGMSDELDQRAASYIEKCRRTQKGMNNKRSGFTKLFDDIRSAYVNLEKEIDPVAVGTVPYAIQMERNKYAAQKRQEELERKRREAMEQQRQQQLQELRNRTEASVRQAVSLATKSAIDEVNGYLEKLTPENYTDTMRALQEYRFVLDVDTLDLPKEDTPDMTSIMGSIRENLLPSLCANYKLAVSDAVVNVIAMLPSKKAELERAAKASAEEAEKIRAQIRAREEADAKKREQERLAQEEAQRKGAEAASIANQATTLFDQTAVAVPVYQPKAAVKKKIVLLNSEGIVPIITMWWSKEGCKLSTDELAKMFKKQITFCEKCANSDGEVINSEHILYQEEVKAK